MKKILVTTDLSQASCKAFTHAAEHAKLHGSGAAEIILLTVIEEFTPSGLHLDLGIPVVETDSIIKQAIQQAEEKIAAFLPQYFDGLTTEARVVRASHPVAAEIVEIAQREDISLIVMASHGRTGARRFILGSVTERVIRETPCPVLVVPTRAS